MGKLKLRIRMVNAIEKIGKMKSFFEKEEKIIPVTSSH